MTDQEEVLFPRLSPGRGIEDFRRMLETMAEDINQSGEMPIGMFPSIFQTLGRYVCMYVCMYVCL
jgi:hypothetical protein